MHYPRLCVAFVLFSAGGCAHEPDEPPAAQHLAYVIPGINGGKWSMARAVQAFRDAGVEAEFRAHEWGRTPLTLANLTDYEGNRRQARAVAAELAKFRATHPTASIDIVGYSGGGGLAVMIAEELPDWVELRRIILVQPALSPDYDLSAALERVSDRLFNLYSPIDWLTLGVGTQLFGTIDRQFTESAGKLGFEPAATCDVKLRGRIEQRCYEPRMMTRGHFGNHGSIVLYGWNRDYVAPLLCEE